MLTPRLCNIFAAAFRVLLVVHWACVQRAAVSPLETPYSRLHSLGADVSQPDRRRPLLARWAGLHIMCDSGCIERGIGKNLPLSQSLRRAGQYSALASKNAAQHLPCVHSWRLLLYTFSTVYGLMVLIKVSAVLANYMKICTVKSRIYVYKQCKL